MLGTTFQDSKFSADKGEERKYQANAKKIRE